MPTEALPDEPKRIWEGVRAKATAKKAEGGSGVFAPSINALTVKEATDMAVSITTVESMVDLALDDDD